MSTSAKDGKKRKRPPTFQHLPEDRAKKLKRSWVEIHKIRSQWKAQKRKEGLVTGRSLLEGETEGEQPHQSDEKSEQEDDVMSSSKKRDELSDGEEDGDEDKSDAPSSPRPLPSRKKAKQAHHEDDSEKSSFRELNKQAYSRSSLHTRKSHSLHRRRASEQKAGDNSEGRGRGRGRGGGSRGRGRGQPDMRLRMNAMLEKIKRDFI